MFTDTYVKYMKSYQVFQITLPLFYHFFTPPPPILPQGGRGVHVFCIYFWRKVQKDVGDVEGG